LLDAVLVQAAERATSGVGSRTTAVKHLANTSGLESAELTRALELSVMADGAPLTMAALRAGNIELRDAHLIASTMADVPDVESDLLVAAATSRGHLREACVRARASLEDDEARSKRLHRQRSHRRWTNADGMICGSYKMPAEMAGAFTSILDRETDRIFRLHADRESWEPREAYALDALHGLVTSGGGAKKRSKVNVHILIDVDVLRRGSCEPGETCEIPGVGPVSAAWVQGLLGEAFVTSIITRGKDVHTVTHHGRYIRAELRTAMLAVGLTCICCGTRHGLETDHLEQFATGGPTEWRNLRPMCTADHDRKSAGWILGPPDPITSLRPLTPPSNWKPPDEKPP
jgi:hypothetical protein